MRKRFIAFLYCLFSICLRIQAQDNSSKLLMDLTLRPRGELRNGSHTLKEAEDNPTFFVSQRTRLRIQFHISKIKLAIAAQNIRVWGESGQVVPKEGNNTMLNEAWAEYEFLKGLSIKLGRQSLVYDDERILGRLDWNQAGRWHDLALIKFETAGQKLHAGLAYNQDQENKLNNFYSAPGGNFKTMQMIWYEYKLNTSYKFSLLFLNNGFQVQSDSSLTNMKTFGGNLFKMNDPVTFTGTFYYQAGRNAIKQNLNAWMISLYGNYQLSDDWGIHAGSDFLTGKNMDDPNLHETSEFIPLFGTNHKFYGLMDYFYVGVSHNNTGLWDKYAGAFWQASKDLSLKLTGHLFNTSAKVIDGGKESSYLGTEFDLSVNWDLIKGAKLAGGYSQMFPTGSMEIVKARGDHTLYHSWIWAMFIVDVRIFELNK